MAGPRANCRNDVKIDLGEGHNNRHGASILPETLRWLGRGYRSRSRWASRSRRGVRGYCRIGPSRAGCPHRVLAAFDVAQGSRVVPVAARRRAPQSTQAGGAPAAARQRSRAPLWPDLSRQAVGNNGGNYESAASPEWTRRRCLISPTLQATGFTESDAARQRFCVQGETGGARALRVGADGRCTHHSFRRRLVSVTVLPATRRSWPEISRRDLVLTRSGAVLLCRLRRRRPSATSTRKVGGASFITAARKESGRAHPHTGSGDAPRRRRHGSVSMVVQIAAEMVARQREPFQRLEMPEEGLFSGVGGLTVDSLGVLWATSCDGDSGVRAAGPVHEHSNSRFNATPVTSTAFGDLAARGCIHTGRPAVPAPTNVRCVAGEPVKTAATRSLSRTMHRRLSRLRSSCSRSRRFDNGPHGSPLRARELKQNPPRRTESSDGFRPASSVVVR